MAKKRIKAKDHLRADPQFREYVAELYFTLSSRKDIKQLHELYKDGISVKQVVAMAEEEAKANG